MWTGRGSVFSTSGVGVISAIGLGVVGGLSEHSQVGCRGRRKKRCPVMFIEVIVVEWAWVKGRLLE